MLSTREAVPLVGMVGVPCDRIGFALAPLGLPRVGADSPRMKAGLEEGLGGSCWVAFVGVFLNSKAICGWEGEGGCLGATVGLAVCLESQSPVGFFAFRMVNLWLSSETKSFPSVGDLTGCSTLFRP